jgi:hypothetical protein
MRLTWSICHALRAIHEPSYRASSRGRYEGGKENSLAFRWCWTASTRYASVYRLRETFFFEASIFSISLALTDISQLLAVVDI